MSPTFNPPSTFLMLKLYSGEVTLAFAEWWRTGRQLHAQMSIPPKEEQPLKETKPPAVPRRKAQHTIPAIGPNFPKPILFAADPVCLFHPETPILQSNLAHIVYFRSVLGSNNISLLFTVIQGYLGGSIAHDNHESHATTNSAFQYHLGTTRPTRIDAAIRRIPSPSHRDGNLFLRSAPS